MQGVVICPTCNSKVRLDEGSKRSLNWDTSPKGRWVASFFEAIKLSLIHPEAFFQEVGLSRGLFRPLLFAAIISVITFGSLAAFQAGFAILGGTIFGLAGEGNMFMETMASAPFIAGSHIFIGLIVLPLLTILSLFISACLSHVSLMICGAANREFEATLRVICYASSPNVLQIIPFIGIVGAVWQLVLVIIGLKTVHNTTYGKAVLAVFLPTLVCCAGIFLFIFSIAGGLTAAFIK